MERIYFIQYGEKKKIKEDQKNYLILALEIEDVGILPIEKIEIYEIIWRVHDRSFVIDLEKDKLKNIDLLHEIYLVADEEDNIDDAGEFFHELFRHFSFINTHEKIYQVSELQILFSLGNAEHSGISYRLICRFDMDNVTKKGHYISSNIIHIKKEQRGKKNA